MAHINFYSLESDDAYRELAVRDFNALKSRIRSDIADRFEALRIAADEAKPNRLARLSADSVTWTKAKHLTAALYGLLAHGEPPDVALARDVLNEETFAQYVRDPAIGLIRRFGDESDIPLLMKVVEEAYGETSRVAAQAAIAFAKAAPELVQKLVRSKQAVVRAVALDELKEVPWSGVESLVTALLKSETDTDRLVGIYLLWSKKSPSDVAEVLKTYLSSSSYHYNVVTWLDRLLNAPELVRKTYEGDLLRLVTGAPSAGGAEE
jgi:hypothetical protein